MDINLLLSPQELPRESPPSTKASVKKPRKPRPAKAASNNNSSYQPHTSLASSSFTHNAVVQAQHAILSPPTITSTSAHRVSATSTPSADSDRAIRQSSTSGMDTLADLASMQHHQKITRANAGGLRSSEIYETQPSSTSVFGNLSAISRPQGALRGSMELATADASNDTPSPHRQYSTSSISKANLERVSLLTTHLASNPFAYEYHMQLVKLLHQGLVAYIRSCSTSTAQVNPRNYELLQDLRKAREAMNVTFALGEDLWVDWIEDQMLLADTLEDRITVLESCRKSVEEESGSTRLWLLYAEWMLSFYKIADPNDPRLQESSVSTDEVLGWSEEDRLVAREVCSWQQMMSVWKEAIQDTQWRMSDSHLIWDRYTEILLRELASSPSRDAINATKSHFLARLQIPHAKWDQTFQAFSSFVSQFDNSVYEDTMVSANRQGADAKLRYEVREALEQKLLHASENSDNEGEWGVFNEYLDWEMAQTRKKNQFSFQLVNALYQRATLRFPTDTNFWEGFVMFLSDEIIMHGRDLSALPVLDRATSHCPWSGTLWSEYLLAAERDNRPFPDMHNIKHKATSTGLLDAGDMSEVLKVHTAWCGFLRRRAFQHDSTDEDMDVAEVGIRSAIEDMETLGRAKYGKGYHGDPEYRLQRIYIKYLSQCCQWQSARNAWKGLTSSHGDNYDFWLRYYLWEMSTWGKLTYSESELNGSQPFKPNEATQVLRQALQRPKLDWPEKIIEAFQYHCEDHEDVEGVQTARVQLWKARRALKKRREKEAQESHDVAQLYTQQHAQKEALKDPIIAAESGTSFGKRKREDDSTIPETGTMKKHRLNIKSEEDPELDDPSPMISATPKRDRENSTVIVKNLPFGTTEARARQYFRECGTIKSINLVSAGDHESKTATIEFESKEDVLAAQTKDMKMFDSKQIEVLVGAGSTLFVTNFPPTADEEFIRNMFVKFGNVVDVRFPSLKKNTHRRFCYVQFDSNDQAEAATKLNGKIMSEKLKLIVKISDPVNKQDRTGAIYEGREVHLANLDWGAIEEDVSQIFSRYGKLERVRIPRSVDGKSRGFAFVTFSTKEEALAALDMNLKAFKSRLLNVSISTTNPAKRQATTIITPNIRSSNSPTPDAPSTNGEINSATSPQSRAIDDHKFLASEIRSRTIALLNVPDTVNDTRIRALAEPYGALVKVVLRPDHQGAIIEYKDVASVGKAALALEGHEIAPERRIGVGSVGQMLHQKAETKHNKTTPSTVKKAMEGSRSFIGGAPISRPNQTRPRRGGKGGLGIKRGGAGLGGTRAETEGAKREQVVNGDIRETDGVPMSNADFKAIFLKS